MAALLHVCPGLSPAGPKKEAPFLKTLGGHRRYPEHAIRELVDGLAQEVTALPP